jgi:hypothetical protein
MVAVGLTEKHPVSGQENRFKAGLEAAGCWGLPTRPHRRDLRLKAQNPDEGGRLDARSSLKSLFRVYKKGLYIPVLPLES